MRVTVKLFAAARQAAEAESVELELSEAANVGEIRRALAVRLPGLKRLLPHAMIAVNADYAPDDAAVRQADEIALIPPVSGG